jgi:hypothetical protein
MLGVMIQIVFPNLLTRESLRRAFVTWTVPTGFGDGLLHGFFSLPRALFAGFPPNAPLSLDWLYYYPGFLLGLFASLCLVFFVSFEVPSFLVGFDARKETELADQSYLIETSLTVSGVYLAWCLLLAIWAFIG